MDKCLAFKKKWLKVMALASISKFLKHVMKYMFSQHSGKKTVSQDSGMDFVSTCPAWLW